MNPLTPKTLLERALLVVGIPYRACKHAGVTVELHDDGTARDDRFAAEDGTMGVENRGPAKGCAKLEAQQMNVSAKV